MPRKLTAKDLLKEVREIKKQAKMSSSYLDEVTKILRKSFPDARLDSTSSSDEEVVGNYILFKRKKTKKGPFSDFWVEVTVSVDPELYASVENPVYFSFEYEHDPDMGGYPFSDELDIHYEPKNLVKNIVWEAKRIFG